VSQKNKTPNSCPHLRQVLINFRHFFIVTLGQEICIKAIITDPTKNQRCLYTTLWNMFPKTAAIDSTAAARQARTLLRNATVIGKLLPSNYDETEI